MTPSVRRLVPAVALPALVGVGLSALTSLLLLRLSDVGRVGDPSHDSLCVAVWLVGAAALVGQGIVGWLLIYGDGRDSGGER